MKCRHVFRRRGTTTWPRDVDFVRRWRRGSSPPDRPPSLLNVAARGRDELRWLWFCLAVSVRLARGPASSLPGASGRRYRRLGNGVLPFPPTDRSAWGKCCRRGPLTGVPGAGSLPHRPSSAGGVFFEPGSAVLIGVAVASIAGWLRSKSSNAPRALFWPGQPCSRPRQPPLGQGASRNYGPPSVLARRRWTMPTPLASAPGRWPGTPTPGIKIAVATTRGYNGPGQIAWQRFRREPNVPSVRQILIGCTRGCRPLDEVDRRLQEVCAPG